MEGERKGRRKGEKNKQISQAYDFYLCRYSTFKMNTELDLMLKP